MQTHPKGRYSPLSNNGASVSERKLLRSSSKFPEQSVKSPRDGDGRAVGEEETHHNMVVARSQENTFCNPLSMIAPLNMPDGEASSMSNLLLSLENFLISGFGTDASAPSKSQTGRFIYFPSREPHSSKSYSGDPVGWSAVVHL